MKTKKTIKSKGNSKLWALIKSLSKGEKKSIQSAVIYQKEGKSNTIRLYEAIEKQKVYDERALKKIFEGTKMVKHFAAEKVHLYDFILKNLADYHQNLSPKTTAFDLLKRAQILLNKGFYTECHQLLEKTKKMAQNYSLLTASYEAVNMQMKLANLRINQENQKPQQYLIEDRAYIVKQLDNANTYQLISKEIYTIYRKLYGATSEEVEKNLEHLMEHPLLQDESEAISYESKKSFYYVHSLYNAITNHLELSNEYLEKRIQWAETKPFILKQNISPYLRDLLNLVRSQVQLNKIEESKATFRKLQELPHTYPTSFNVTSKKMLFTKTLLMESMICFATFDFGLVPNIILKVEETLLYNETEYDIMDVFHIYCHLASIQFYLEEYNQTIDWCNRILGLSSIQSAAEERIAIYIFNMLSHYELGNYDLLPHLVQQVFRYMNKMGRSNPFKRAVLNFIKSQLQNPNISKHEFQKCKDKLTDIQSKTKTNLLPNFNILGWLDSKIQKKTFLEIYKGARE
ncbi:MAG: hypothetical protein AB8B69_25425 [Chitinophagales bacterium]